MPSQANDYKSMLEELQRLISDMQSEDLDIDTAIAKYEKGRKLLEQLKNYLEKAENKVIRNKIPKDIDTA
jgi:exodeoxyribonuclease VII small subunit